MGFYNENSMMVKSAVLLLTSGVYKDISQIPDLFNLREVVVKVLEKTE